MEHTDGDMLAIVLEVDGMDGKCQQGQTARSSYRDDSREVGRALALSEIGSNWAKIDKVGLVELYLTSKQTRMSQERLIQLKNKSTGEVYWSRKNKKKVERKIELSKYSKKLRKHVVFKEAKK